MISDTLQDRMTLIAVALRSFNFRTGRELRLQDGIAEALRRSQITARREYRLDRGPIDFYIDEGRIGIEVKVAGSPAAVWRQLVDYAADPKLDALILASTKRSHGTSRDTIADKPFLFVPIAGLL